MAFHRITRGAYETLIAAYRIGELSQAEMAKHAGVAPKTVKMAWHRGFPQFGFPPIQSVLEAEKLEARALANQKATLEAAEKVRKAQELREQAATHAAEARAHEGKAIELERVIAIHEIAALKPLVDRMSTLAKVATTEIDRRALLPATDKDHLTAARCLSWMRDIVRLTNSVAEYHASIQGIDERHFGPQHKALMGASDPAKTADEAAVRVAQAIEAFGAAQRSGRLLLLQGGLADDPKLAKG